MNRNAKSPRIGVHGSTHLRRWRATLGLLLVVAIVWPALGGSAFSRKPGKYEGAGLAGSGQAEMQPVNLGVRVAVLGAVPGSPSREVWAIGRSTAKVPGWAGEAGGGQTVFLQYTASGGWSLKGPPTDAGGVPRNPNLTSLSLAANGEGWAVGDGGVMARRDGERWVIVPSVTDSALYSVSIGSNGEGVYGFAVGDGPTVLRLSGGRWSTDSISPTQGENWDLVSVSAVGPSEAWAGGSTAGAALIVRRTSSGWSRRTTGAALFDERGVRNVEGRPIVSTKVNAVAASPNGAWLGGIIVPVDASAALGDVAGDPTRPFTIWFPSSGQRKTYCPDEYSIAQGGGRAATNAFCDLPMPLAGFGITSMATFGDGVEAFAGGLGLFHFKGGQWLREPDPISSVSSVAFVSPSEGWIAGTGNTYGVGGSVSSISTLGHWALPHLVQSSRVARWPTPITHFHSLLTYPFEAVKLAPDGTGRGLAVGQQGASALYKPEVGWDSLPSGTAYALHGLAWPASNAAWAVGGRGTIIRFDGSAFQQDPASEKLTTAALFGVAFSSARRGYAVGANGAILKYDGVRWTKDPAHLRVTDRDLYAIDSSGDEFVAVGSEGTLLVNRAGSWVREDVSGLIQRGGRLPAFYAVDGLSNGSFIAGGELATLIRRDSGGDGWRIDAEDARVPPEGTILALAGRRTSSGLAIFASVSYETLKFAGDSVGVVSGFLMYGTSEGWRDLDHNTRITIYPNHDASGPRDPVLGIALDGGGTAWAVGGTSPGTDDGQGHTQAYPTGSIYRVSLSGDPRATGHTVVPTLDTSDDLVTFAFFGESGCGRGLCSATMGSGTKADEIALKIREEINAMSRLPGGPKFAVFGGNMRAIGAPEELGEFKRYADGFTVRFYAALGLNDMFGNLQTSVPVDAPDYTGGLVNRQLQGPRDDSFYLDTFNDFPKPWGTASLPPGSSISPAQCDGALRSTCNGDQTSPARRGGAAATHYAFDHVEGSKRLRVIVIDDSQIGRVTNQNTQNPPEKQDTWLTALLQDARNKGAASIIVMNRPGRNPLDLLSAPYAEANPIQNAAAQVGASAVLTSYHRLNAVDNLKIPGIAQTVPIYVFGGGGAPLDASPERPPDPSLGYYHSWQLISVSFDPKRRNVFGQYEVYARSFPVMDTVSLHAVDGTSVEGGKTLRFTATGRATDGGGPAEPLQSRAAVVPLDFRARGACPQDPFDGNRPKCTTAVGGAIGPQYQFISENPRIGYFVKPSPISDMMPQLTNAGNPIADSTSGLFCSIGVGTTFVNIVSGFHRARMKVTVSPGFGPCVKQRVVAPGEPPPRVVTLEPPLAKAPVRPFLFSSPELLQSFAIVVPPTVPILAPAPPAAGGYARKEEHEEATETEESEFAALRPLPRSGRASLTAVREARRYRLSQDPLMMLLSSTTLALMIAVVAAGTRSAFKLRARAERMGAGYPYGGSP